MTNERIAELEAQGAKARRECRSSTPSVYSFNTIERSAYRAGWERENAHIEACMTIRS